MLPPESGRLSPETIQGVSGETVDLPPVHWNGSEPPVETDCRFVPGEDAPLQAPAAAADREPGEMCEKGLADSEPDAGLFRRLGICLYDLNQLEPAKAAFKRALSLDHSDMISKRRLSLIEMRPAPKVKATPKPRAKKVKAPVAEAMPAEVVAVVVTV